MFMKINFKGVKPIFKNTFKGWMEDDPFRQSAVIAYYAIFSLPALLVLIINIAGFFFGTEKVTGEITRQIGDVMGDETSEQVGDIVQKASDFKAGVISSILAIATIIFGSTGVFVQLQKNLNQIWDVKQKPNKGFMRMLKSRLFSFGLIISIGFLLLMSLVISAMLAVASYWLESVFSEGIAFLFYALDFIVSLTVISFLFGLMFKVLPDVKIKWRDILPGSFLTGFLFILGKYALSFYFGKADPASVYGAAGSVILILLWTSYSSMIVFFGAEFTKQNAVYHGKEIQPTDAAEKLDTSAPIEQKEKSDSTAPGEPADQAKKDGRN
jgi:membrane protein